MKKTWIYILMLCAAIGMIVAAGSVATAEKGTAPTKATAAAPAGLPEGVSPVSIYDSSSPPNFVWFVITFPADSASTTVFTVPAGYRLKIDDVVVTYGGSSPYTWNYLYRGTSGITPFMYISLGPYGHFEHSYQNLVLNGGEILKVWTYFSGGPTGVGWTITGHYI